MKVMLPRVYFSLVVVMICSLSISCKKDDDDEDDDPSFTLTGSIDEDAAGLVDTETSGTPTSFKVTLYRLYASLKKDCTDPVLIGDHEDGEQFDIFDNPTLFTGTPADGSYNCLIIESNDVNILKPDAEAVRDHAGCKSKSKEYKIDVFREGNPNFIDIDGEEVEAHGTPGSPEVDKITAFFSTDVDKLLERDDPPNEYQTGTLENAMVVPGTAIYKIDLTDRLSNMSDDGEDYCWAEQTPISFE